MQYPERSPLDKTANITPTTIKIKKISSHLRYTPFVEIICLLLMLYFIITLTQILPVVNRARKRLAAIPCQEEESASVEWSRLKKDVYVSKTITSVDFVERIFDLMGWDRTCRYKILGRLAQTERGLILVFDFTEAIMFAPKPVEYIDKITGLKKKRQVKYYPDEYKYKIGKSYNDYVAFHQQSLFENLEEYTDTTVAATPTAPLLDKGENNE